MYSEPASDQVRHKALTALTAEFIAQGHAPQYASVLATSTIFQTDLDLRNAQLSRLLAWLQQNHSAFYKDALAIVENTRAEFEKRVKTG